MGIGSGSGAAPPAIPVGDEVAGGICGAGSVTLAPGVGAGIEVGTIGIGTGFWESPDSAPHPVSDSATNTVTTDLAQQLIPRTL